MNKDRSISDIESILVEAGIKPTAQRIAVCQYVLQNADHPTAEDVKDSVDAVFPKISLATVYNTLNTLVKVGLLKAIRFPHSEKVIFDCNTSRHHHFFDESDGTLIDLDANSVSVDYELPDNYQVEEVEVFIKGSIRG